MAPARAEPQTIDSFQHTAWTIATGAPADVWALAQTSDGYLWLGTGDGLYRFDGVRFTHIVPQGSPFPHTDITALLTLNGDDLLIGYQDGGISLLHGGRLSNYPDASGMTINRILRDASGRIWAHAYATVANGGLARLSGGRWQAVTAGLPSQLVPHDIASSPDGALWVLIEGVLYTLPPGARAFVRSSIEPFPGQHPDRLPPGQREGRMAFGPDGSFWFLPKSGALRKLRKGHTVAAPAGTGPAPRLAADLSVHNRELVADDGALWAIAQGHGILRVGQAVGLPLGTPPEAKGSFGRVQGLSSNLAGTIFEDREKNIWIGTNLGIDRFHAASVVVDPAIDPTSRSGYSVAPGPDGSLYVGTAQGLYLLGRDDRRRLLVGGDVADMISCPGPNASLWATSAHGLVQWIGTRAHRAALPAGVTAPDLVACAQDVSGRLWIASQRHGLYRHDADGWRAMPGVALQESEWGLLVANPLGGMWTYFPNRPLQWVSDGNVRAYAAAEGLAIGDIEILTNGPDGTFVGGESGLAWFDGQHFRSLRAPAGSPLRRIAGIVETDGHKTGKREVWINTESGVIEIDAADLLAGFQQGRWPARYRLFDRHDGLPGFAQQDSYRQTALRGADGRLWFITNQGIAWIDPCHLPMNPLPPPVVIEDLTVDGRSRQLRPALDDPDGDPALVLPAGTQNIQIDYTAPSLRVPERVTFRYRLEGVDTQWVDPGMRRQAFYTKLGPGDYTFRVIAANDSGVWSRHGAALRFTIRPRFTQTAGFIVACVLGTILLSVAAFLSNLSRVTASLRGRLDERLRERERIARELHDTMLQGFQGLQLHFQSVAETISPADARRGRLEQTLALADAALAEARDRIRDLRSTSPLGGLPEHVRAQGERLLGSRGIVLDIIEDGPRRDLDPAVEREFAAIVDEAIFNVVKHAQATQVTVRFRYGWRRFGLTVTDDGIGIGNAAAFASLSGHFGVVGMRERSLRLRGTFNIGPARERGTELRITLPSLVAYGRLSWLLKSIHPTGV